VDTHGWVQRNFLTLEKEVGLATEESLSDCQHLLSDNRQDFNIDSVELIEAAPCALLAEARKEATHHLVVNLIRAVEHDTEDADCFSEILSRLSFSGTSWTGRVSAKLDVEGTSDGDPASVSERRDDETGSGSHVLVAVL
jgi:hypothetical protein